MRTKYPAFFESGETNKKEKKNDRRGNRLQNEVEQHGQGLQKQTEQNGNVHCQIKRQAEEVKK